MTRFGVINSEDVPYGRQVVVVSNALQHHRLVHSLMTNFK